jgi:hypothetical protein
MKSIPRCYLPRNNKQRKRFYESLYIYLKYAARSFSPKKNLENIISECDEIMQNEASDFYFSATDSHLDYVNEVSNRKKQIVFLIDNFDHYEKLLTDLLLDNTLRITVFNELEMIIFRKPRFINLMIDMWGRVFGYGTETWINKVKKV